MSDKHKYEKYKTKYINLKGSGFVDIVHNKWDYKTSWDSVQYDEDSNDILDIAHNIYVNDNNKNIILFINKNNKNNNYEENKIDFRNMEVTIGNSIFKGKLTKTESSRSDKFCREEKTKPLLSLPGFSFNFTL